MTTAARTARAFRRLHAALARNHLRSLLTSGSRLRLLVILFCSLVFWGLLFALFFEGFQFLATFVKLSNEVVEYLFGVFFLSLLVMLVFSTGIILYTGLFGARESAFLLATPAGADRIFAYKFVEAMGFSTWGFFLLGSPMMVAYGLRVGAPRSFYLIALLFHVAFVLIPGGIGGMGAIFVAYYMPRQHRRLLWISGGLVVLLFVLVALRALRTPGEVMTRDWLDSLLGKLAFSQAALLPSRWISRGLIDAARGETGRSLFYLGVTSANAGLAYLLATVVARDLYRTAYSRVQGGRSSRRPLSGYGFDAIFHRVFGFLPAPIRLLILKDLRTFRRDPVQWSQFVIFFGLLAFYFVNIRRLGYHVQNIYFRNILSFLNLAVTALILSTFTSRFIFPMLSLEGRNLWVLGLLPLRRGAILWGKFAFASGISLVATEGLILLSDWMLELSTPMIAVHVVMVAILCLGLSGISVGLGARLPNLKEDDPSRIATGFGGTLNLVVSLIFIFIVVGTLALPVHYFLAGYDVNSAGLFGPNIRRFEFWLGVSMMVSLVIGILATVIPLRIGIRAFERMEI